MLFDSTRLDPLEVQSLFSCVFWGYFWGALSWTFNTWLFTLYRAHHSFISFSARLCCNRRMAECSTERNEKKNAPRNQLTNDNSTNDVSVGEKRGGNSRRSYFLALPISLSPTYTRTFPLSFLDHEFMRRHAYKSNLLFCIRFSLGSCHNSTLWDAAARLLYDASFWMHIWWLGFVSALVIGTIPYLTPSLSFLRLSKTKETLIDSPQ